MRAPTSFGVLRSENRVSMIKLSRILTRQSHWNQPQPMPTKTADTLTILTTCLPPPSPTSKKRVLWAIRQHVISYGRWLNKNQALRSYFPLPLFRHEQIIACARNFSVRADRECSAIGVRGNFFHYPLFNHSLQGDRSSVELLFISRH